MWATTWAVRKWILEEKQTGGGNKEITMNNTWYCRYWTGAITLLTLSDSGMEVVYTFESRKKNYPKTSKLPRVCLCSRISIFFRLFTKFCQNRYYSVILIYCAISNVSHIISIPIKMADFLMCFVILYNIYQNGSMS